MDHVFLGKDYRCLIGKNERGQLTLTCAAGEVIASKTMLTAHACHLFSADTDEDGVLHIACVTAEALTYLRHERGKTSTTHLMRLPEGFTITGVFLLACGEIRLYYCVKSREGYAVIRYTLAGENWQGANLMTASGELRLLCAHRERGDCLIEKRAGDGLFLLWAGQGKEIPVFQPVKNAQACGDTAAYCCGEQVCVGDTAVAQGEAVYVLDREHLLVRSDEQLREIGANGRLLGQSRVFPGAKEYVLCEAGREKRILLSPPFPFLRLERERADGSLAQEVYLQQRTLFSLQAEVRELKQRVKRLEEERKR